jgi:hypothetical protein
MAKSPRVDLGVQSDPKARPRRTTLGKTILTPPVVGATIRAIGSGYAVESLHLCPACNASVRVEVAIPAALIPGTTVKGRRYRIERNEEGDMIGMTDTPIALPVPPPIPPK